MVRRGFSLAEVIVAMMLLSIGTLGVAATGFVAAEAFTRAEMQERVLRAAESVLDSLLALPGNGAGTRSVHGSVVSWSASGSTGTVVVRVVPTDRPPFEMLAQR